MTSLQAILLGIIQGLTEFLPVSSSGHLIFLPRLFGWTDQGLSFDVVVHLGTLCAVVFFFRKRLREIIKGFFIRGADSIVNRRFFWLIVLSIIPAGLVGFFGGSWIETHTRSISIIGWSLIFWGVALALADRYHDRVRQHIDTYHMKWPQIAFIACAQAIALIPGTSRSGITMTAGLFTKLDRKSAVEFSFLMSIPVIFIAGAAEIAGLFAKGIGDVHISHFMLGFLAAAISGWIAIAFLMKVVERWSFIPFAVYRIIVGILILML